MKFNHRMRVWHRYLGFFLAGIMAVYALSGIALIFRKENTFKVAVAEERTLSPQLDAETLGRELRIRDFKPEKEEGDIVYFENGTYNKATGLAKYTSYRFPYVLDKMTQLHKADTGKPLYYLNIFFGLGLLFFVLSSFFMFLPKTGIFKKGIYAALAGLIIALLLLFI